MADRNNHQQKWPVGAIKKIVVHNFLTYNDTVECSPGQNLNLIIGCNGTGKSTLICAICLAMGGSPKLLGRSERMQDYIKHGRDAATVTLSLNLEGDETANIECRIFRRDTSPIEYFIDNKKVTAKKMKEYVCEKKIQIDNPCTFLAQDKVKCFSAQSPKLLLENTEKAASTELWDMHVELDKSKNNGITLSKGVETLEVQVKELETQLTALDPLVQVFRERQQLKQSIELLKKKEALMMYEETRKMLTEVRSRFKIKTNEANEAKKAIRPQETEIERLRQNLRIQSDQISTQRRNVANLRSQIELLKDKIQQCHGQTDLINRRFEAAQKSAADYENQLKSLEEEVQLIRNQLEQSCAQSEDEKKEMRELNGKRQQLNEQQDQIDEKLRQMQAASRAVERQIRDLEESGAGEEAEHRSRVNMLGLMGRNNGVADAWRFVTHNGPLFANKICIPLLCMCIKENRWAMYLENLVGVRDLQMFICQSSTNENRLQQEAKQHNWKINSTVLPANNQAIQKLTRSELFRLAGFQYFADELFQCPDIVKQYLCKIYRLHQIPIGCEQTDAMLDRGAIDDRLRSQFSLFLTPTRRIQSNRSKYTNKLTTRIDDLRMGNNWLKGSSASEGGEGRREKLEQFNQKMQQLNGHRQTGQAEAQRLTAALEQCRQQLVSFRLSLHILSSFFTSIPNG